MNILTVQTEILLFLFLLTNVLIVNVNVCVKVNT